MKIALNQLCDIFNNKRLSHFFLLQFQILLILQVFIITGCGPFVDVVKVEEGTISKLDKIQVFEASQITPDAYKYLGTIKATSCKNLIWDPPSTKKDAVTQLKYKVSNLGGNGLTNLVCKEYGTRFDTNCWSSVTCDAVAIKTNLK